MMLAGHQLGWSMSHRIAILGASSFAGRSLVEDLSGQGHQFLVTVRAGSELPRLSGRTDVSVLIADVRKDTGRLGEHLLSWQPTVVLDLAGQGMVEPSWSDPRLWFDTNLGAKAELLMKLKDAKFLEKYIRFSTPEVFGQQEGLLATGSPFAPSTPYAVTHAANDFMLQAMFRRFGFPAITCRFANFYGPGQQLYRLVPRALLAAATGEKFPLEGGGSSSRAFIYRSDIVSAASRVMEFGQPGMTYHFSPEATTTIRAVVSMIAKVCGVEWESLVEDVPGRPSQDSAYILDTRATREELGWEDCTSLEVGIEATKEWVYADLDNLRTQEREFTLKR